jgi:glycerophosphoryl diester phosphodiesterase
MKNFFYILLIALFSSCQKERFNINNLNGSILVMGHGGMGVSHAYPMNTFESIMNCINFGTDGTEIDVQMTQDGVLLAYHDKELSNKTNKCGLVNDFYWNDLQSAYYTNVPYLNYSILSLEQLFSNIDNLHEHKFIFDCKLYSNNDSLFFFNSFINSFREIIIKYSLQNNVYFESQNSDFLTKLKNDNPEYKLFVYPPSFEVGLEVALNLELFGITISTDEITREQIEIAHSNNLFVSIWNVNSINENIAAINKNPDCIQTDKVKHLVSLLE